VGFEAWLDIAGGGVYLVEGVGQLGDELPGVLVSDLADRELLAFGVGGSEQLVEFTDDGAPRGSGSVMATSTVNPSVASRAT
jgi:hypothetical protein